MFFISCSDWPVGQAQAERAFAHASMYQYLDDKLVGLVRVYPWRTFTYDSDRLKPTTVENHPVTKSSKEPYLQKRFRIQIDKINQ